MKKFYYLILFAVALFGMSACQQRDLIDPEVVPIQYAYIGAGIGRDADDMDGVNTKSIVSVDVENFRKAALFAFNPSTGKILTYGSNAPESLQGKPIAVETDSKEFSWSLPLNTAMDIYVLVNYGNLSGISSYLSNADLTKASLNNLKFSCVSSAKLQELESMDYGLPMSGILSIKDNELVSGNEFLQFRVKKLFAKYHLYLDLSDFESAGNNTQVVMEQAQIYNMNTSIHYFQPPTGDKSTISRTSSSFDRANGEDLNILQKGGKENEIVFYVLENMQGNIEGANSWTTVYEDLGSDKLKYCTYLSLTMQISDDLGRADNRNYRIYLGQTDMKSNFDVKRNVEKTIKLNVMNNPMLTGLDYVYFTAPGWLGVVSTTPAFDPGSTGSLYLLSTLKDDINVKFKEISSDSELNYSYSLSRVSFTLKDPTSSKPLYCYRLEVKIPSSEQGKSVQAIASSISKPDISGATYFNISNATYKYVVETSMLSVDNAGPADDPTSLRFPHIMLKYRQDKYEDDVLVSSTYLTDKVELSLINPERPEGVSFNRIGTGSDCWFSIGSLYMKDFEVKLKFKNRTQIIDLSMEGFDYKKIEVGYTLTHAGDEQYNEDHYIINFSSSAKVPTNIEIKYCYSTGGHTYLSAEISANGSKGPSINYSEYVRGHFNIIDFYVRDDNYKFYHKDWYFPDKKTMYYFEVPGLNWKYDNTFKVWYHDDDWNVSNNVCNHVDDYGRRTISDVGLRY